MTTTSNGGADLQALMAIADRYARRLAADAGAPAMVLLVERAGDLDIVMLDGDGRDVVPQVRLRLARSGATSAALLVEAPMTPDGATHDGFWILGEGIDGTTARRRYRVRPCGRTRRLTPLADGEEPEVEDAFRPLFPVHQVPGDVDDGVTDEQDTGTSSASADTVAIAGHSVAA